MTAPPTAVNVDRAAALDAFLARCGWADATRSPLAGDASFRRYVRLRRGADTAMLMDAPPPHEGVRPYLVIARLLSSLGYSAPQILGEDVAAGFLLIEDFGDRTYTRALGEGVSEAALYESAVD